jgi:hypothetical protein
LTMRSMTQALWSYRGLIIFAMINSAEANSTKEHDHVYDRIHNIMDAFAVYLYYVMKIDFLFMFEAMCEVIGFVWLCVQIFKIAARRYVGKPLDSDIKLETPLEERTRYFKTVHGERLHLSRACGTIAHATDANVSCWRVCIVCLRQLDKQNAELKQKKGR